MKTIWGCMALVLLTPLAWADRTPSVRSNGQRSPGTRTDITVPYLGSGKQALIVTDLSKSAPAAAEQAVLARGTAFGAYKVSPRIYTTRTADEPNVPGAKPGYNLPFYGARMGFGRQFNGYIEKPTLLPSHAR